MISQAVHTVARIALFVLPPQRAFSLVRRLGKRLPLALTDSDARHIADTIADTGTCLSRAMATASRIDGGTVAIGVHYGPSAFRAHAWVLLQGRPLRDTDPDGEIIAILN